MSLFKKVACMTDLHCGLKSNSILHLSDCEEYVDWFIATAKKENCDIGICMGDWSHNRNNMSLVTLDTSIRLLEKLGKGFDQFFWFPGNHDLFFKDKRDIHSSSFAKHIPGVTVVNGPTTIDNVTLVPWLIWDEWKKVKTVESRYIFGHFELPLFYMNAMVQMPDHGELKAEDFVKPEYVFSGHFHKRQSRGKVHYIGNCFPHNYSDNKDNDRGMMILEWGGEPRYINWDNAPKYRILNLSELIDKKDDILKSKMYLRVNLDIDISFEEANLIKETFNENYDVREMQLIPSKNNLDGNAEEVSHSTFESVDQIVSAELVNIESDKFDKSKLLEIYNKL